MANMDTTMRWAFMGIPTAILMWSEAAIAARPAVSVALAGIESGANLDTDRFGFSVEATDINETGFKVTIRRLQGGLVRCYGELARVRPKETVAERLPNPPTFSDDAARSAAARVLMTIH
jgi:hypothetical protein